MELKLLQHSVFFIFLLNIYNKLIQNFYFVIFFYLFFFTTHIFSLQKTRKREKKKKQKHKTLNSWNNINIYFFSYFFKIFNQIVITKKYILFSFILFNCNFSKLFLILSAWFMSTKWCLNLRSRLMQFGIIHVNVKLLGNLKKMAGNWKEMGENARDNLNLRNID